MRSLIVRFKDHEGPGILEEILKDKNYCISYHNAYESNLQLIPDSHQIFDLIILLGGPQSVYDSSLNEFFKPYYKLVENALSIPKKKVLGICLGSQIIAKALGAEVQKGSKGQEIGFSKVNILDLSDKLFQKFTTSAIDAFHYHGDVFNVPSGCKRLLSSSVYENQMFAYNDSAYAIQCHFEVTKNLLKTWYSKDEALSNAIGKLDENVFSTLDESIENGKILFENIIG